MHVSDAIIGLLLSLIFCNCENDLSSVDTTAFIASRISIDLSPSNVTNLNETEPTLNNTDTSNWIEIVATTATSTENVTTTSTTTVIITSTSARINETAHSKTPSVMNTTSTPPQNTVKPTTPSAKPNLGLILGLSLGLGLPFLIVTMPTSSESLTALKPLRIAFYKNDKGTAPSRTIETVRNNQFHSFRNQSSPNTRLSTLRDIDTSTDYLREAPTSVNGSIDDKYFTITIPFNITLYNTTTTSVTITINGVICLRSCSTTFIETAFPISAFSDATILTYWNDLYIYANTSQVIVFENMPGVVQFIYYEVIDEGASATVGVQGNEAKQ
ncbi:unnamed protein product [Rotaria sordida]|uniref:Uncharacterized protein n=1 Tax=Rotaria sordida TaxID=392033 RepID=A0A818T593_9BILA|nr:unnamed protein product [Rotaria sordida]